MTVLYILPNQIYNIKYFSNLQFDTIILWEHPDFYTKYKFNKKKLILHRASMRQLYDRLKKKYNVKYISFNDKHTVIKSSMMYDPINIMSDFKDVVKLEPPNFLVSSKVLQEIYLNKKTKTSITFTSYFYPRIKEHINILVGTKSTDKENRKGRIETDIKKTIKVLSVNSNAYVVEAIDYVNQHFPKNYGNTSNFIFPTNEQEAIQMVNTFIKESFKYYGTYQDTILKDESVIFHSCLSSSLNIGLIEPMYLVERASQAKNIKMNSKEGFIRQLIWREFQRYCYIYLRKPLKENSRYKLTNKLKQNWYNGTTGIYPIDITIKKAFDRAYLHHIERLMVIGNYMLLSLTCKEDGFRWFMEFAIDSYEWVMYQNVYDMVFFSTNGKTSYKPYISSSKYIMRMSDYKNIDNWAEKWDKQYKSFKQQT